jgi:predicted permease
MAIFRRIANLFSRSKIDLEIEDELRSHIEMRVEDNIANGMSREAARRDALLKFGNPIVTQEKVTHIDAALGLDTFFRDVQYAWRMLWRSKGFTAVAVGSLALGIGANTIVFSLAKGVLLDRLAVPKPEQLKLFTMMRGEHSPIDSIWGNSYDAAGGQEEFTSFSYRVYTMLRAQNAAHRVVGDLFAYKLLNPGMELTVTVDGRSDAVTGQMVSGNYYEQLGVRTELGRRIEPADDVPGAAAVTTISDAMWSRRFGRSPDVIGKTILLQLVPVTIVGVNPPEFTGAASVQVAPDVFFPLSQQPVMLPQDPKSLLTNDKFWWVQVMARTFSNVPTATAQATLQGWLEQDIRATLPMKADDVMPGFVLADGSRGINDAGRNFHAQVYVLSALTGLVLLLACANLANLLLARSAARQREMAVRLALGASRRRLLRQMLTESLLLSSLGGAAGLALGYLGRDVIPGMYSATWTASEVRGSFDWTAFGFTAGVSLLTGVLFGLAPAWQAMRTEANASLKDTAVATTRRRRSFAGRGLVMLQVALSMLLVVGAGLFVQTMRNLDRTALGLDPKSLVMFSVHATLSRYPAEKGEALHERIIQRLERVPGVEAVTVESIPLLAKMRTMNSIVPGGQMMPEIPASYDDVDEHFFGMYRIPILRGRNFTAADKEGSPRVALINETLGRKLYPGSDPVGRIFRDSDATNPTEIIGVTGDAKYDNVGKESPPTYYSLYRQEKYMIALTYVVKTRLPVGEILPRLRAAVAEVDRDLPLRDVRTQEEQIDASVSQERTFAMLTGAFGVLALSLACVGIYGLMAYDVARRTNEIGIRMALGARAGQMMGMVLREASWMSVVGIIVGLSGALLLTKYVKSMLYGLTPNDPWILGGAAVLLFVVALLAGWGPARKASRIDPMEALRHE